MSAAILQAAFCDLETHFRKIIKRARAGNEIAGDVDAVQTVRALVGLYLRICTCSFAPVTPGGQRNAAVVL